MRVRDGWLELFHVRGVPLRVHWTTPIGALLVTRFRWAPGALLAFALVIAVHEAGHALLVASPRREVLALDIHAGGGECRWRGEATPVRRAVIAWGGVLAQLALLAATLGYLALAGPPAGAFARDLTDALVVWNLWMVAFNLLPLAHHDGVEAWRLVGLLYRAARSRRRAARPPAALEREPGALEVADPRVADDLARQADAMLDKIVREAARAARRGDRVN